MKLQHSAFRGELPILDARLLPENNAQVARNLYLRRGTLKPERAPGAVTGLPAVADPATLYRYPNGNAGAGFWFVWGMGKQVDVVKSPLANDEWHRVYWTGDGVPKVAGIDVATSGTPPYPSTAYTLGMPAPTSAPQVAAPSNRVPLSDHPDTAVETAYVVTVVSAYGEEGPPSNPSAAIVRWDMVDEAPAGGNVEITLPAAPSGAYNVTAKRLYRVESGGVYQFVAEVSPGTSSYTDSVPSESLGRALPSTEWDGPDARMIGLTALPNGILAGFFENTLCFSEAYLPHAWPVGYQLAFPDDIVAIASTAAGLVVVTEGQPHLVSGSSPEAMAQIELDVNQSCVSRRSLVDMGEFALYASPDGLVAAAGRDARVATREVMSREQWQALKPETIHAYRYDGRYLAFYESGCFTFTPGEGIEFFDITASGGYYDIADDTLYLIQDAGITAWGKGDPLTFTWRSRLHEIPPGAAGFTCAKVIARDYPVALRLFADGEAVLDLSVKDAQMFRLPAGYTLNRDWEIELAGTHEVNSVQIATSPTELV
ncbi:hypothetical protein RAN53_09615 [Halomonas sp. SSL-5]|uniref:hypothetical protein n=1 Tax=Halomonas sp. SSL-5 TaxID=3065855 RepID=UPI002738DB8E|nr:hypothetical protein [Halomonas sp. SSL-5]MDY7116607.1 hypothetical protein [Halomonas sp. SSL-5]